MLRDQWRKVSARITILGNFDLGLEDWGSFSQVGKGKKCFLGRRNSFQRHKEKKDHGILTGKGEKWISM